MSKLKVLIADQDTIVTRNLVEFLQGKGMEAQLASDGEAFQKTVITWLPDIVLTEMLFPGMTALEMIDFIKSNPQCNRVGTRVVVTSAQAKIENVKRALKAGAVDYIVKPFKSEDLIPRLAFYIQEKRQLAELMAGQMLAPGDFYLHLTHLVMKEAASGKPAHDVLFNLTKMMAIKMDAVRCSVIETHDLTLQGFVRASSDDHKIDKLKIDLGRYPEVCVVMNKENMVAVENMGMNPVLAEIKKHVQSIQFNALIVCPVRRNGKIYGVMSCRMKQRSEPYSDRELLFAQLVAHAASLVMSTEEAAKLIEPQIPPPMVGDAKTPAA